MRLTLDNPRQWIPALLLGLLFVSGGGDWIARHLAPWHFALAAAVIGFGGWIWNHRRYRSFADTPDCAIASAPQGYIRISGIGRPLAGTPLLSPAMHGFMPLPCLWYRIKVEERDSDDRWHTTFEDESEDSFLLVDEDGAQCEIRPAGASVITAREEHGRAMDERSTLWLLIPGTRISASGAFRTHSVHGEAPDLRARLRDKLADWKANGEAQRFDLDQNGELDMREWDLARAAAQREVRVERTEELNQADSHFLAKPDDGRPFILSDRRPDQIIRRLRWQAWGFLLLFFAGVAGLAYSFAT